MNRRASDKARRTSDKLVITRNTLIRRLQRFTYEQLAEFSVSQLQSIILGLFGRKSSEYAKTLEIKSVHSLAHTICDECDITYPGKCSIDDVIKMVEEKIKERMI